jgi:ribosomal-protein-alanine N-acetyltransferase
MSLPDLESPRLRLRAFQESDIEDLYRLWIEPAVCRYLWDDRTISRELATETVKMSLLSAETETLGMWMLLKKDDGSFSGFCGFPRIPASAEVELLFGLWPHFGGHGLATEASRSAIDWFFATHALDRLLAGADAANTTSIRVLRRLGMAPLQGDIGAEPGVQYYEVRRTAHFSIAAYPAVSLRDSRQNNHALEPSR